MTGRLIDADVTAHEIDQLPQVWEYGQAVVDCYKIVKNAPTVEAIPVWWIQQWADRFPMPYAVMKMLIDWQAEQRKEA